MPRVKDMIESKYLRKEDIDGEQLVTILKVGQVNVAQDDQPPEMKWAIRFQEIKKPMILNSTNIQALEQACGSDDSDDWAQRQVILYVDDNVSFQGKRIGGLRLRAHKPPKVSPPAAAAKAGAAAGDEDIPF